VRLLQKYDINVLICNGIKNFYRELLESAGLTVIDNISVDVDKALRMYIDGKIKPRDRENNIDEITCEIPHEDLVCWEKELFESHGYEVKKMDEESMFPVDLVAAINCPICRKSIKVAVCCGAHTYRADQEIREFHHRAASRFEARVYVYPGNPGVKKRCREYDIQLIDPDSETANLDRKTAGRIPLLEYALPGHKKAFAGRRTKKQ
jgi:hypothetical protein